MNLTDPLRKGFFLEKDNKVLCIFATNSFVIKWYKEGNITALFPNIFLAACIIALLWLYIDVKTINISKLGTVKNPDASYFDFTW